MNVGLNKIAVIGLGYIGLSTAALLASRRVKVIGVDTNADIVETINLGKVHISEPDLASMVQHAIRDGFLSAVSAPEPADAFLITVPTPFKTNYQPDLSKVESAVDSIVPILQKGNLIILESTSPVGTTDAISRRIAMLRKDLVCPHQDKDHADIHIAYCPERVMQGRLLKS